MRAIVLLPQAEEDLNAILEPRYSEILHKIRLLREFPELGPAMSGPFGGYRSLTIDPFRVIYGIVSIQRIDVAYIFHCKRNPKP